MIGVEQALSHIAENRPKQNYTSIPISDARHRILAKDVIARVTQPPLPVSAMDGYAVRSLDVMSGTTRLKIIGEAPAGSPFSGTVQTGETVRVFTGSVIPEGTDQVVIQEDVTRSEEVISFNFETSSASHIRAAGLDFAAGDVLIKAGTRLTPYHQSVSAAANHAFLDVVTPMKVALITSGNELKPPGSKLNPGEIINSNSFGLAALIADWGALPCDLGIASDDITSIRSKIGQPGGEPEIFVSIGGASVGDYDFMRRAFEEKGFTLVFEKVAVKPGKPTWFAKRDNQVVLGLPGNPASALVCANIFLKPLITGQSSPLIKIAKIDSKLSENGPRETYLRARSWVNDTATLRVSPYQKQDSSLIRPFLNGNCLIKRKPHAAAISEGELVEIIDLN